MRALDLNMSELLTAAEYKRPEVYKILRKIAISRTLDKKENVDTDDSLARVIPSSRSPEKVRQSPTNGTARFKGTGRVQIS